MSDSLLFKKLKIISNKERHKKKELIQKSN